MRRLPSSDKIISFGVYPILKMAREGYLNRPHMVRELLVYMRRDYNINERLKSC